MSKYQELCELAVKWQDDGNQNWQRLLRATFRLTHGFAHYIDATGVYSDAKTGNGKSYVEAMRHGHKKDDPEVPMPVLVDSYMDAIEMERDGFVRFSIATTFEGAPDMYPKFRVGVFLRMKFAGDTLIVQLLNKKYVSFELDLEDQTTHEKLFAAMVDLLETSFKMRSDNPSCSIGFALTGAPAIQG